MSSAAPVSTRSFVLQPLVTEDVAAAEVRDGHIPTSLRAAYGGDLIIPLRTGRPTVISNFVTTLDGVVSYETPGASGGGEISGFFEPDRFVMGLLRSLSDVVLVGAGTLRAGRNHEWSAEFIHRPSAAAFLSLRMELGLTPHPVTAIVTASGEIDLAQRGLANPAVPVLLITTDRGAAALRSQALAPHVDVAAVGTHDLEPGALIDVLAGRGARVVLCEGGPRLFGQLLAGRLIDDLFVTIAPQVAGRSDSSPRLNLVEQTAFPVGQAPWARLVDLRRSSDHLFARYRFEGRDS